MKKWKLALFLCICMCMCGLSIEVSASGQESQLSVESEDFTYTISNGEVTIKRYTGEAKSITIPDKIEGKLVTGIGENAFYESSNLTSIQLPSNLKSIGERAFYGCNNLISIQLPSKLQSIGKYAFDGTGITSITIPKTVTVCESAFSGATELTEVVFEDGMKKIPPVALFSATGKSIVKKVVIPESITAIGEGAFSGCSNLTSIQLPSKLQSIGDSAFIRTGITSITIPKTVTVCESAFSGAGKLTEVIFEEGMTKIPSNVLDMQGQDNAVTKVVIPESVTEIGEDAFSGCSNLTSIQLPSKLESIGEYAFYGTGITDITLPSNLQSIGRCAFLQSEITSITIPKTVTECEHAFQGAEKLREVIFEEGITTIPSYVLHTYTGNVGSDTVSVLTKVVIPETVTEIGEGAFFGCNNLTSIQLPSNLKTIGEGAFRETGITSITIPKTVTECKRAFIGTEKLTEVIFEEGMTAIPPSALSEDYSYDRVIKKVIIPKSVTAIGEYAFHKCIDMTIYGYANSYAQTYANQNNIPFVDITGTDLGTGNNGTGDQTGGNTSNENTGNTGNVPNDAWLETVEQADMRMEGGKWLYYENGAFNPQKYDFVGFEGGVFLVANGVLASEMNGLAADPNSSDWYYTANGQVQTQYTGLVAYDNAWFYVNTGRLDTELAGYVDYDGSKFYVADGKILTDVNGLAQDPNTNKWYYLAGGQAQLQYTGLAEYDGAWFYIKEGALAEDYIGNVTYNGSTFYVVNGKLMQ